MRNILNYKDALSASGSKGVTQHYPHTPGIDAAGVVEHAASKQFQTGNCPFGITGNSYVTGLIISN